METSSNLCPAAASKPSRHTGCSWSPPSHAAPLGESSGWYFRPSALGRTHQAQAEHVEIAPQPTPAWKAVVIPTAPVGTAQPRQPLEGSSRSLPAQPQGRVKGEPRGRLSPQQPGLKDKHQRHPTTSFCRLSKPIMPLLITKWGLFHPVSHQLTRGSIVPRSFILLPLRFRCVRFGHFSANTSSPPEILLSLNSS